MKAVIIHGTKGSPEGNWFPWLSEQLQKIGVETRVPRMPTPENQSLDAWIEAFDAQCGPITDDTILIGHSCGAVLILRLLEKSKTPAGCTVLVAPPYGEIGVVEIDELNSSFLRDPFRWDIIRSHAGTLMYFMAENDQYVPQSQLWSMARALKVDPIVVPGGGHLNAETGYTSFPLLLDLLKSFIQRCRALPSPIRKDESSL